MEGNISNAEKKDLVERLNNQLDDSLRTNIISYAGVVKILDAPAAFDSVNVGRSILFMSSLLKSIGYYAPAIRDSVRIDTVRDQHRVTVDFQVRPGKKLIFDSVGFDLSSPVLEQLARQTADKSLLKKDKPYSKQVLSDELDRLVELFHNNGYYRFSKEDLVIEADTVIAALIDPSIDPFEQLLLLQELKKKRDNPSITAVVKQRPVRDSSHLTKYYIGDVTIYPDLPILEDTALVIRNDTSTYHGITVVSRSHKFKGPFIVDNVYLQPGNLYKQENYYRTYNRLNQLPAWQLVNIDFTDSYLSDSLLDVSLRLYPAKKQNLSVGLETSYNTNDILAASNLFGISLNLELRNRNAFRQSVQSITDLRGGVELGPDFIQTTEASISHSFIFPKLITPFHILQENKLKNIQTILNVNASYTQRRALFAAKTLNGSWGYQWARGNKTFVWKPINIEYTTLLKTDSFQRILNNIPSLNLAFKTGLVIGEQFFYSSLVKKGNRTNLFRATAEESGALLGLIKSLDQGDLLRFVKADLDFTHTINIRRTQLVFHGYAGGGVAYGLSGSGQEQTLPFYKAFYAGGPNSMRGWQVRQLGLGSSTLYDSGHLSGVDRFGDIRLEGNLEYRFPLGTIYTVKINSAVYADVGNIWNRKVTDTGAAAQGSDFNIGRFYNELAVDAGTGLRLDFNFFILRLDWAYKLRDPQRLNYPDRWFYGLSLGSGQFQLGIGYPF
jgi:outer membrane protein insertion porin family